MVEVDQVETLIANLSEKHGILQCPLDLQFDVGSQVAFYISGGTSVHLSGYVVPDEDELFDEEEEEGEEEEEEMDTSDEEGTFAFFFYYCFYYSFCSSFHYIQLILSSTSYLAIFWYTIQYLCLSIMD